MAARFFGSGAEDAVAPTDSQLRDDVASRSQFAPSSSSPRPCAPSAAAAAWREATDRREKEDKRSGLLLFFSSSVGGSFEGKKYRVRHSLSLSLFDDDACVTKTRLIASNTALRSFPSLPAIRRGIEQFRRGTGQFRRRCPKFCTQLCSIFCFLIDDR